MERQINNNKNSTKSAFKDAGPYLNISSQLIAPILLGVGIGYWIDTKHDTGNLWTLTLSVIGVLVGLYNFVKIVIQNTKKKKSAKTGNE